MPLSWSQRNDDPTREKTDQAVATVELPVMISAPWFSDQSAMSISEVYAPQTKILDGRTNRLERIFEALSKSRRPNPVLTPLKSGETTDRFPTVRTTKIFVWGA